MTRLRRVRFLGVIAAVSVSALVLSGCSFVREVIDSYLESGGGSVVEETGSSTGEEVAPELEPYYHQSLTWTWSGTVGETTVTVPLDWADPIGETIEIAVARSRPTGPSKGMLLINPGGPGGTGYEYGLYAAGVTYDVADNFDVIGFDPRGVGRSTPITCYTTTADRDEMLYGTYDAPYGSSGWIAELTARQADWIEACQSNTGDLLGHLDAASVARDMDVIRAVLGDDKLDYLGYSYGTYLGAMYAELFPDKVGRMVLDGAVDPSVGDLEMLATQMSGFDSALRSYLESCFGADQGDCPFSGSVDRAMSQVRSVLEGIDARHLTAEDGRVLDSATLGTAIASTLYSEWSWPLLTDAFAGLELGDPAAAFEAADAYYGRYAGYYDGNGNDIYIAVICDEGNLATDGVDLLEGLDELDREAPALGRYMGYDDFAVLEATCTQWPYPPATLPTSFDAAGAAPILVIGTTNDPATPYAQAVSLSEQLDSGVLISYQGEGHTIYSQGVSCIDSTVDAYLIDGVVPSSDPMC